MESIYQKMSHAIREQKPFVLALISGVKGSSPQRRGAKALFFEDGSMAGTLGGGCLEAEVRRMAGNVFKTRKPETFDLLLDHNFGWDDGLICGGRVTGLILPHPEIAQPIWDKAARREQPFSWGVRNDFQFGIDEESGNGEWLYQEKVAPPVNLWIAGSGHIAQAVAPLAANLDFRVTVLDDRPDLANHAYFPADVDLRVAPWHQLLREPAPNGASFGLIVTRGHQHDAIVLQEWIQRPFAFLGMIGSKRKKQIIFSHFLKTGVATEQQLNTVACPVGLDINGVTVAEIGISIAAQLVQKRAELSLNHA